MNRPQNSFRTLPRPKKVKDYPKIKSHSKVRSEGIIEDKSYSTTWVDPKTAFEPYPNPKNSPLGPQKVKNDAKFIQNKKLELKKT